MRSAIHKLKQNRKASVLGSTVITIKRGFDAAVLIGSMHLNAVPGAKKIVEIQLRRLEGQLSEAGSTWAQSASTVSSWVSAVA